MISSWRYILALLFSSLISLGVVRYQISASTIQQSIGVLLVILLVIINRFVLGRQKTVPQSLKLLLVFMIATFLQLLILTTGGFSSHFLILFHLLAIVLGFLVSFLVMVSFLGFSLIALIVNTLTDEKLSLIFKNDPWTTILYIMSFAVIIPIYQVVVSRYNLKEAISNVLKAELKNAASELKLTQRREESLIKGLSDIVIMTDKELKILSSNEILEKVLRLQSTQIVGEYLFDLITLKTSQGVLINPRILPVGQVVSNNSTYALDDLLLYTKTATFPSKVNLKIRSNAAEGGVIQLLFIFSEVGSNAEQTSPHNFEPTIGKQQALLMQLEYTFAKHGERDLEIKTELLGRMEQDLLNSSEIEDHNLTPALSLEDIAQLVQQLIVERQNFSNYFQVPVRLIYDPKISQQYPAFAADIEQGRFLSVSLTNMLFLSPVDNKWLKVLLNKILDVATFLASGQKNPQIEIVLSYDESTIYAAVSSSCPVLPDGWQTQLLSKYFGNLNDLAQLKQGSGLEGFLIKSVTTLLNIHLGVDYQKDTAKLIFTLGFSKKPVI